MVGAEDSRRRPTEQTPISPSPSLELTHVFPTFSRFEYQLKSNGFLTFFGTGAFNLNSLFLNSQPNTVSSLK